MELKSSVRIFLGSLSLLPLMAHAADSVQNCGAVSIAQIVEVPQKYAIVRVSNTACGNNGLLCIKVPDTPASQSQVFVFNSYQILQIKHFDQEDVSISVDLSQQGCDDRAPLVRNVQVLDPAQGSVEGIAHQN